MSATLICLWLIGASPPAPGPAQDQDVERLWAELSSADPARAETAIGALAARPLPTVAWLKEHLRPVPRPDARQVARWLAALDDRRFAVRRRAARELAAVAEPAEPILREALRRRPSLELRKTVERCLDRLHADRLRPPPERRRAARAVEVLERIGNPEARRLLAALAAGAPEAMLSLDARGALERLARDHPPTP